MRILLILLALVAAPAWAEWVAMGETADIVAYIDPATIKKDGNLRRIWQLHELKQRDKDGTMSKRALVEYDCKEERQKVLSLSSHSEPWVGGKVLGSGSITSEWQYIAPNTTAAAILKIVCAK